MLANEALALPKVETVHDGQNMDKWKQCTVKPRSSTDVIIALYDCGQTIDRKCSRYVSPDSRYVSLDGTGVTRDIRSSLSEQSK